MALKVIMEINQRIKCLDRISPFIDEDALIVLAGALVGLKKKLQTSQNKLVRSD